MYRHTHFHTHKHARSYLCCFDHHESHTIPHHRCSGRVTLAHLFGELHVPRRCIILVHLFAQRLHANSGKICRVGQNRCICTEYDRMYGDFPAKYTVCTPYIPMNVWFWPTLKICQGPIPERKRHAGLFDLQKGHMRCMQHWVTDQTATQRKSRVPRICS